MASKDYVRVLPEFEHDKILIVRDQMSCQDKTARLALAAKGVLDEYDGQMTVRQLYYQLVARGVLHNIPKAYTNICTTLTKARQCGVIPFEAFEDRARRIDGTFDDFSFLGYDPAGYAIAQVRAALNKAVDWGLIERSPGERVKLNRADRRAPKRVLAEGEIATLLRVLRDRDAEMRAGRARANAWRRERDYAELPDLHFGDHMTPLIVLLLNTGMRRGEAFSLEWRDVALDMETVTVRGEVSKSGQSRTIPLNGQALEALRAWKAQPSADGEASRYVFPGATGGRMTTIQKAWRAVCKAAGLEGLGLHSLRHTFCSRLAAAGIPATDIGALAGHSSIVTTQIYMRSGEPARRRAVDALGNLGSEVIPFPAADQEH